MVYLPIALIWLTHATLTKPIEAESTRKTHLQRQWNETKYLIAFGDSYTFVQGTAGYSNDSFIGSYLPGEFAFRSEKLLTSQIVQNFTGTAEGGPNWVEFLTGCAVQPGKVHPRDCEIELWDFAFSGADVSEEFLPRHHHSTIPMVNQTQQYLTWEEPVIGPEMDKSRALVAVWIGINNVKDSLKADDLEYLSLWECIINAVIQQTAEPMYEAGYRNFLFLNLPPLDRNLKNQVIESPLPNKVMVQEWNDILARHTQAGVCREEQ